MSFIKLVQDIKYSKINDVMIINVILKNSKKIIENKMTLLEISNECNISHSSVSRLITKLGWPSWNRFVQSCIVEEIMSKEARNGILRVLDLQKIKINKFINENQKSIKNILTIIKKHKTVLLFGERLAGNIAQFLSFLFSRKKIMTIHFFFENELHSFLRNKTVLIVLTTNDKTNYNEIFQIAKEKGATTILIDSSEKLKIDVKPDVYIKLPLVTYFENIHSVALMRTESIRYLGIEIFDKL